MRAADRRGLTTSLLVTIALIATSCLWSAIGHAEEAEDAFKARCGECHGARDIQHWGRQRADAAARQAWLEQFLRRHYPPPESERAPIISHIQSTIAGRPSPQ